LESIGKIHSAKDQSGMYAIRLAGKIGHPKGTQTAKAAFVLKAIPGGASSVAHNYLLYT
jgi:hypothetical protein